MDNYLLIEQLKKAGIGFAAGLCKEEIKEIESVFGFRFPSEIKTFLACGVPIGDKFFSWRDLSAENVQRFRNFQHSLEEAFLFDLKENTDDLQALLGDRYTDGLSEKALLDDLHASTRLIPFYAHRCFFDGMDGMPIVSFYQPVDSIFYGENFEDYLAVEFLGKDLRIRNIPAQMRETGIWYYLIG